jgi:hypothetical protein
MKKISYFFVLIIAFSINCSSDKNSDIDSAIIKLNLPESGEDTLKTSSFADTVVFIPLETTKESLIQFIDQIWMNDSVILINGGGSLLMFLQNGKFIRQIGKNGRGPGEYLSILHFDVIRDTIYISTTGRRSLLRYTFEGAFCDEIKFNYTPAYFSSTADQKLACYIHAEGEIYIYNKNLHTPPDSIVVEYGVTENRYRYVVMPRPGYFFFQKTSSNLLFNSFLSDTIWNITGNKKEPALILNLKDRLLPFERQIEFSNGDFERWDKMANPFVLVHIIPFPSLIFIFQLHHVAMSSSNPGYDAIYLYSTKTGEIRRFSTSYIYDDIVSKQKLSHERLTYFYPIYSEDYLVTSMKPLDVLRSLSQNERNGKEFPFLLWLDQMKSIKEDDNPLLIKIKIKNSH